MILSILFLVVGLSLIGFLAYAESHQKKCYVIPATPSSGPYDPADPAHLECR